MVNAASPRLWVPRSVKLKRNRPGAVGLPTNADRSAVNIDRAGYGCVWAYRHRAMLSRLPGRTFLSQRAVKAVAPAFCGAAGRRNSAHGADRTLFPWWGMRIRSAHSAYTGHAGEVFGPTGSAVGNAGTSESHLFKASVCLTFSPNQTSMG